jgi:hypothetical protein
MKKFHAKRVSASESGGEYFEEVENILNVILSSPNYLEIEGNQID